MRLTRRLERLETYFAPPNPRVLKIVVTGAGKPGEITNCAWTSRGRIGTPITFLPVAEGGGECDLGNIRTFCLVCHRQQTP